MFWPQRKSAAAAFFSASANVARNLINGAAILGRLPGHRKRFANLIQRQAQRPRAANEKGPLQLLRRLRTILRFDSWRRRQQPDRLAVADRHNHGLGFSSQIANCQHRCDALTLYWGENGPQPGRRTWDRNAAETVNVASLQQAKYRGVLWIVLVINAAMFAVEIGAGVMTGSASLQADALDFLGDAASYGISLFVVCLALRYRAMAALFKGATMGLFGLWVIGTTVFHIVNGTVVAAIMALLALQGAWATARLAMTELRSAGPQATANAR